MACKGAKKIMRGWRWICEDSVCEGFFLQKGWRETRKTVAGGKGKNTRNDTDQWGVKKYSDNET